MSRLLDDESLMTMGCVWEMHAGCLQEKIGFPMLGDDSLKLRGGMSIDNGLSPSYITLYTSRHEYGSPVSCKECM